MFFLVTDTQACEKFIDLINKPKTVEGCKEIEHLPSNFEAGILPQSDFAVRTQDGCLLLPWNAGQVNKGLTKIQVQGAFSFMDERY